MNRISPLRYWGRRIAFVPALVLMIAVCICPAGSIGAPTPQPLKNNLYTIDAYVAIISNPQGGEDVSIAYTTAVSKEQLKADLVELQRASGWKLSDVKSESKPQMQGASPTTSMSMHTLGPVDYQAGYLRLEPFVMALKRLRRIEVQFLITGPFDFRGLQDFRDDTVNVVFSKSGVSYNYSVELAKNDFQSLNLPGPKHKSPALWIVLVMAAVIAGAAAYWVSARYMKSRSL